MDQIKGADDKFTDEVNCKTCGIDNCKYCVKEGNDVESYISCNFCEDGFGLSNNQCLKCTENCEFCQDVGGQCTVCKQGYTLNS